MRIVARHYARISSLPFYQEHCFYLLPMMGWFVSSALLSAYNKFVFGNTGKVAFPCPLLLTSVHFASQWIVSVLICAVFPEATGLPRIKQMTWKEFFGVSVPCGVVTAADVGLSNLSMVSISLTFYTMVKASTPIFVLFWAWLFQIERITWPLMAVIGVIAMGEFFTVFGETNFVLQGFIQCLCASVLSGARWTLVQLKLQTLEPPLKSSLATMRILAPSMFVSLLFTALLIEKPWQHLQVNEAGYVIGLGAIGATFAIAMTLCEFMLIMQASAIVLMIGGVVKELLNIGIGMAFFGDTLNLINTVGFMIVFGGVVMYKFTFHGPSSSTTTEPPLPVVERYGRVATHSDSAGHDGTIHSKSSNEDVLERFSNSPDCGAGDEEQQQQGRYRGDDNGLTHAASNAEVLRRRSDNSDDAAVTPVASLSDSDKLELRESKGTLT